MPGEGESKRPALLANKCAKTAGLIRIHILGDDRWVTIVVSDTGGGLREGVRWRIFLLF
jgi:signal transduction histidine kinase